MKALRSTAALALVALVVTTATVWINPATDERAMYGWEGPPEQNWLPRKVGGWPAPFIADSTATSVPHKIGVEDAFRAGPFVASWAFWFVVSLALRGLLRRRR